MPEELSINYEQLLARLIIADLNRQLPGTPTQFYRFDPELEDFHEEDETRGLTNAERAELIMIASLLALSSDASDRTRAYEIVTRLLQIDAGQTPSIIAAADIVLARLGNFPGRSLARQRFGRRTEDSAASTYLSLEVIAREVDNTIALPSGKEMKLTDFQHDLFEELDGWSSSSTSAPTSSGKSFVLTLDIARKLRARSPASIIYVVPTRALIRQVMLKVIDVLDQESLGNVPVRCVPLPVTRAQAPQGAVYVLTQERLISLLNSDEEEPWITTLIIDEAQGIGDGARGIILHSATDAVLEKFPNVKLFFASPMTRNPEYLLEIFGRRDGAPPLIEEHSPVSQNIILVRPVHNATRRVDCRVIVGDAKVYLGERSIDFRFGGETLFVRRAKFAIAITRPGESTIVYANEPRQTEQIANVMGNALAPDVVEIGDEIRDLIDFLRDHIHPDYSLIKVLERGVAFHYGAMPAIVRSAIEDLFQESKIRFICCTSTLLQGVNLPARHIVIENPYRGRKKKMSRRDFLNLAGRAGRLLKEFQGNVWCLCPDSWDERSFEGPTLQPITSAFEETLADGGSLIRDVLDGKAQPETMDVGVAAVGKVFADFVQAGKPLDQSSYRTPENEAELRQTAARCAEIKVDLPPDVFRRNATILPTHLQELYEFLKAQPTIADWLPLAPYEQDAYVRMKQIFQVLERIFTRVDNGSHEFHAWLAWQWIHQIPLQVIIQERANWLASQGKFTDIDDVIADLMETLENDLRYRYTKHLRAYNDVLAFVLREAGQAEPADHLQPLHLFIECGASDPVVLNLIAIGLSRTTAIMVRAKIRIPRSASPEECLHRIQAHPIASLKLPKLCERELKIICRVPASA